MRLAVMVAARVAGAAPASVSWSGGTTGLTRTIGNVSSRVNERVIVSPEIEQLVTIIDAGGGTDDGGGTDEHTGTGPVGRTFGS
ncbi:hypothetical protein [Rhodococcus marinonascens]|uniref:hypothetical protein n=1 Tax=Rhodococcus marinonascens TaxID=38311 RepID=UPI0011150630|nr:hypothetical protein [Rhodococcus marinonascens]